MFHFFTKTVAVRSTLDVVSVSYFEFTYSFNDVSNFTATENDEIDPESISTNKTDGPVCKFGNLALKRGEKLKLEQRENDNVLCRCDVPPFVTCSQTGHSLYE